MIEDTEQPIKKFNVTYWMAVGEGGEDLLLEVQCDNWIWIPNSPMIILEGINHDDDARTIPLSSFRDAHQNFGWKADIQSAEDNHMETMRKQVDQFKKQNKDTAIDPQYI